MVEEKVVSNFDSLNMMDKAREHAKKHAEMKMKAYCKKTNQVLETVGISKEACKDCHENLSSDQNIEFAPKKQGTKTVKNWEEVSEDQVELRRKKIRDDVELSLFSNNIQLSKKAFKGAVKDNLKNSFKPGGSVGLISGKLISIFLIL